MKAFLTTFSLFLSIVCFGQDTTDIYVINNTNRLVAIDSDSYSFIYRDLKTVKEIRSIHFESKEELDKFFELCQKALDKDQGTITSEYNVSRNKLSKNVVRVNDKSGGYALLKYSTIDHMRKAAEK